jgi:bleomycin hydrolase
MSELTLEETNEFRKEFLSNPTNKILQNVLSKNDLTKMAINREVMQLDHSLISQKTNPRVKVTNQKSSGRCWMFAALNVIRRKMMDKYNLPEDFELSQSYLFFWDKIERMNYNLECIIENHMLPVDDRLISGLMSDPVADGGQWDMMVNLIRKYGVVPKSVFTESHHSSSSRTMNALFKTKFRETALRIKEFMMEGNLVKAWEYRKVFNKFVYNTLCKLIGTPPTNFTWKYLDKNGGRHVMNVQSPQQFFTEHVPFDLDDYVCVINDPREGHGYYKLYTVNCLNNVIGGQPVKYLNVPMEDLKQITLNSLRNKEAVWFGCDVGKERLDNMMIKGVKEYGELLGTDFSMSRADRLNSGESLMTHAMVFSGFNEVQTVEGGTTIGMWEVENSWGKTSGKDGYYLMSDEWFDEYMYEVVVHRKYATQEMLDVNDSDAEMQIMQELPLWDPMGALA